MLFARNEFPMIFSKDNRACFFEWWKKRKILFADCLLRWSISLELYENKNSYINVYKQKKRWLFDGKKIVSSWINNKILIEYQTSKYLTKENEKKTGNWLIRIQ